MTQDFRAGSGLDFHRFMSDPARPLLLGGVEIPGDLALIGHSDADVILHALSDAILGALALGDIGELFPDTNAEYKNMDSRIILAESLKRMRERSFMLSNVDITVIGETPRIKPFRLRIRQTLAALLDLELARVSLKATTTEKMGFLGRQEGLGCHAIALLHKS